MKHLLNLFICFLFLGNSIAVFGQNDPLETETAFMNCLYNSLPDKGKEFKLALQKAEQKLIDKNLLKEGTGESYAALYKNIYNTVDEDLQNLGILSYMGSMQEHVNTVANENCMKNVFESTKYSDSKFFKFLQLTESIDSFDGEVINQILAILTPKNLEHDYYKMTTFIIIETMNTTISVHTDLKLPEEVEQIFTKEELESALKIELNAEGEVFVSDKKISLKKLRKKVISYLKENKSKSVISFSNSREVPYKYFIDVQNELIAGFDVVRNELAKEKFNSSFNELQKAEKDEIKKTYPLRIKETTEDE